jgi:hypothetical protein
MLQRPYQIFTKSPPPPDQLHRPARQGFRCLRCGKETLQPECRLMQARTTSPRSGVQRHSNQLPASTLRQRRNIGSVRACNCEGTWRALRPCSCRSTQRRSSVPPQTNNLELHDEREEPEQRSHIGHCHLPQFIYLSFELPLGPIMCRQGSLTTASQDGQGSEHRHGCTLSKKSWWRSLETLV